MGVVGSWVAGCIVPHMVGRARQEGEGRRRMTSGTMAFARWVHGALGRAGMPGLGWSGSDGVDAGHLEAHCGLTTVCSLWWAGSWV